MLCPDLKNVFFGKIHRAPSEVPEVKRQFSRSRRPNFGFHLFLMSFHLEFLLFRDSRLFDLGDLGNLRRGSGNFWNQCVPMKKMRYVTFSLNLSTSLNNKNSISFSYIKLLLALILAPKMMELWSFLLSCFWGPLKLLRPLKKALILDSWH